MSRLVVNRRNSIPTVGTMMRVQLIRQSATLPRWRQRVRASSPAPISSNEPFRLEHSDVTVRWTVTRDGQTERNLDFAKQNASEPRHPLQKKIRNARRSLFHMVPQPSGKARVCKTLIRQFKSGRYLQNKKDIQTDVLFVLGRCRAGFERSIAVRMSTAGEGLTEPNLNFCLWQKCKQIWPVPPKNPRSSERGFFYPSRQAWHIITTQSCISSPQAYIITRSVYFCRLDDIQNFVLMICNSLRN